MSNENQIADEILLYLDNALAQAVIEQAIPDSKTVKRNAVGAIDPYVAIQFGDIQQGQAFSFAGPRWDDYILPVYTQVVAPDPAIARRVGAKVRDVFLGASFPWTGSMRKRAGGAMFPIVSSSGATEAYIMPASFGVLIQFDS